MYSFNLLTHTVLRMLCMPSTVFHVLYVGAKGTRTPDEGSCRGLTEIRLSQSELCEAAFSKSSR